MKPKYNKTWILTAKRPYEKGRVIWIYNSYRLLQWKKEELQNKGN